jgi:hypothetical protein
MTFEACSCFLLRCDGCGRALAEGFAEAHFPAPDPTDQGLVEAAEEEGWTTDGERWHCQDCPELHSTICRACRAGFHLLCKDPDCACLISPDQAVLPGIGEEAFRG